MFNGILIQKDENGYHANISQIDESQLPEGDVTVQVNYSSLNYKDGLAISGKSPVVRQFPMVPGIDLAGTVIESATSKYNVGDHVVLNGWGVGEKHWGGLAQIARLNSQWLIPLPKGLTPKQAMAIGTAGYTAMLAVMALEKNGIAPHSGKILVTGANGGVGSFAIAILSRLGYQVIASTGRPEESEYLIHQLGAAEVIDRKELSEPGKPLMKERWAGAVDSVGSYTLANVCASTAYGGTVAACGLAQGMDLNCSVAPFILRGVTLAGIDSVMRPYADRVSAWERLANIVDASLLEKISAEIPLTQVIPTIDKLMDGKVRGRVIVNLQD
ncbi:Putative quinone oxidoreductase YhdH [Pragia fontium]|uniref:acrylyl-CoA reductase (NADPH) n=1 Tax=Pragia fontium TaxID=82985 RepID=UPI00064AD412|nr:MDR family oxidoreductase [Pragia fontium]AKJ42305.1 alcohol dehydrogenase [Pragia fontium]SUB82586.1 Putative quinone oxidoreductase YhdH [Pragia fontium]